MFLIISHNEYKSPMVNYHTDELLAFHNFNTLIKGDHDNRIDLLKINPVTHESTILMTANHQQ